MNFSILVSNLPAVYVQLASHAPSAIVRTPMLARIKLAVQNVVTRLFSN
jgi:hypothetical protein